jgi:hypothetical protein
LQYQWRDGSGRQIRDGKTDQFPSCVSSGLKREGRAVGRRRNERDDPWARGRAGESVRTGVRDLRKRLRPSDRWIRRAWTWRSARARSGGNQKTGWAESGRRLGAERRSHQEQIPSISGLGASVADREPRLRTFLDYGEVLLNLGLANHPRIRFPGLASLRALQPI